ncbi:MAG: phosphate signaling complex protein PhoU [Candidatus Krumholzibacteria bacterium]|nr:phosphate signaling complex protein PhoU [Candidatus Krumholzibacteria bacterium]
MSKHMEREIDYLKKRILALSATVEDNVYKAVQALTERNSALAEEIISSDPDIDQTEVTIEEECLKVLALHQPVAVDLRFIIAILKINSDLERMGDLAVNIAERAMFLATREAPGIPLDLPLMAERTKAMMKKSLDALINQDAKLAYEVLEADDEVDAMNREMYQKIQDGIRMKPDKLESLIHLLSCSRHLERIADHATNIAEDVIYMIDGVIVRHRAEDYRSQV